MQDFQPERYRTPGQFIQELLDSRGWTQRILAIILRIDETGLNKIVAGSRKVDAELAISLADVLGVEAEWFLELQKKYDLARAKILLRPDPSRGARALLFGELPVSEIIKRGWLEGIRDVRDVSEVERALTKFFGASSLEEIELLPHAAKKTPISIPATPAQIAWLYRVRQIATENLVGRYSPGAVDELVYKLQKLLISPEGARKVPRLLSDCGIRFLLVESLPSAKIDGVCFWLDDKSPVVGLSMRYDRIDNFWFVLRHEIEHVRRRDGLMMAMLDTELEGERAGVGDRISDEERAANKAAADFCVPTAKLEGFVARKAPFFAERDLLGFAKTIGVHPGLVAGQIQHRTGRFDRFRDHLVKIRQCVAPSAIVDGWGDVYPLGG